MFDNMQELVAKGQELLALYGLKVLAAIAILIIGRIIAGWIRAAVGKLLARSKLDPIIIGFVRSIVYIALMVFVVLAALGQLGVQTTSFIAVIGAAGLAIGLALQGSLSNFAAGFLMIIFRPFRVGDFIDGAGVSGTVRKIEIFTTTLTTPDNKVIIVPNASLSNGNITNYSANETRRIDLTVGASYDADIRHVKQVLDGIISSESRVLETPEPLIAVSELADSSVNLVVRVWVNTSDYWPVLYSLTEQIKLRFDEENIGMPYPQRDIHLYDHKAA